MKVFPEDKPSNSEKYLAERMIPMQIRHWVWTTKAMRIRTRTQTLSSRKNIQRNPSQHLAAKALNKFLMPNSRVGKARKRMTLLLCMICKAQWGLNQFLTCRKWQCILIHFSKLRKIPQMYLAHCPSKIWISTVQNVPHPTHRLTMKWETTNWSTETSKRQNNLWTLKSNEFKQHQCTSSMQGKLSHNKFKFWRPTNFYDQFKSILTIIHLYIYLQIRLY